MPCWSKLGRDDAGRKLIDEAARDALQLPTERMGRQLPRPGRPDRRDLTTWSEPWRSSSRSGPTRNGGSRSARTSPSPIATTDTKRALALVDTVGGPGFDHERARTAIAYRIGRDRPDEAIRIIEGRGCPVLS